MVRLARLTSACLEHDRCHPTQAISVKSRQLAPSAEVARTGPSVPVNSFLSSLFCVLEFYHLDILRSIFCHFGSLYSIFCKPIFCALYFAAFIFCFRYFGFDILRSKFYDFNRLSLRYFAIVSFHSIFYHFDILARGSATPMKMGGTGTRRQRSQDFFRG